MVNLKIYAILFVALCSSLFAQSKENFPMGIVGEEYFPFNEKSELVFDSNIGETKKMFEVNDGSYKIINESDDFVHSQTFIKKGDGIYLIRTEQNISLLLYSANVDITYSEPVLQLPNPLIIGDTWSWSGLQIKNGDTTSVSISGKILSEEAVLVQAGKFNTIKVKLYFEEKEGEITTIYQWLAPGLGAVKTKVIIEGSGIIQVAMSLLGYDEINSELKKIRYLE